MPVKMDGKEVAEHLYQTIRAEVAELKKEGIVPCLAVVLVGENPASVSYVTAKEKMCEELGMRSIDLRLPASSTTEELLAQIQRFNQDPSVHGILVQLPLPPQVDASRVLNSIDPTKDVDGFLPISAGLLMAGHPSFLPCTPAGIIRLLEYYKISLEGRHAVVVGRSMTVGKPLALLLLEKNCTVTICHSRTQNLAQLTQQADILVAATGKPYLIRQGMVKEGAVLVDVGVNRIEDLSHPKGFRLVGDAVHEELMDKVSYYTPVPGGVGPMTIAMLMYNTLLSAKKTYSTAPKNCV